MVDFNSLLVDRQHAKQLREQRMANRGNAPKFNLTTDDDDFDTPTDTPVQFTADDDSQDIPSIDDLNDVGFNDARDEVERAKLDPPKGDWIKDDRWKCEMRTNEGDCEPGDVDPRGRTVLSFSGRCIPREANGMMYDPMMFFKVSPDWRSKQDEPDKPDMSYKLCLKAKDLFLSLKGEKIKKLTQMKDMLAEDSYVVRTMTGDNGLIVVDIRPQRDQRGRRR